MKLTKKDIAFPLMGEGYVELSRLREVVKAFQGRMDILDSKDMKYVFQQIDELFGEVME